MVVPEGMVTGLGGAGGTTAATGAVVAAAAGDAGAAAGFGAGEFAAAEAEVALTGVCPGLELPAAATGWAGVSVAPTGEEGGAEIE